MATWICPHCSARMNVKDSLIGQLKPCAKCGEEGFVTDENDAVSGTVLKRVRTKEESGTPGEFGAFAKILCLVAIGVCVVGGLNTHAGTPEAHLALAGIFTSTLTAAIVWPFCRLVNDVHAIRKIAEKSDKN